MVCKYCGTIMKRLHSWGDGYTEPHEEYFVCPYCGAECDRNDFYGIEWVEGELKEATKDDINGTE